MAQTKEERVAYMKAYRKEHREEIREYNRRYRIKHFWDRKYYPVDPEIQRQRFKAYYKKHKHEEAFKQRNKENQAQWRERNREKFNAYHREYYRKRKALEVQV